MPPDLRRLLDLSSLSGVLGRSIGSVPNEARWRIVEPESLARLSSWTPFGMRLPVAIFSSVQPTMDDTPAGRSLDLLAVDATDLLAAMEEGQGEVGLECLRDGSRGRKVRGTLGVTAVAEGWKFELRPGEPLYTCPRCAVVLPPGEFQGHRPPGKGMRPCHEVRRSFSILGAGKTLAVELRAHLDPRMLLSSIVELVSRDVRGAEGGIPPQAEPWLDRAHDAYFEEADGGDPSQWITDLGSLLERLFELAERADENEAALADLGRAVGYHRAGLGVLSDWMRSEVR